MADTPTKNKVQRISRVLEVLLRVRGRGSGKELAGSAGISSAMISQLRNGRKGTSLENYERVSEFFGLRLYELMALAEEEPPGWALEKLGALVLGGAA